MRVCEQTALAIAFDTFRRLGRQTGIVMIGEHETQTRQMHRVRIAEPFSVAGTAAQRLQPLRQSCRLRTPFRITHWQPIRQLPIRGDILQQCGRSDFVPVVRDTLQNIRESLDTEFARATAKPFLLAILAMHWENR